MKVIEKGDKLYYTRIFPTVGIYDVCDLTVRTVTDTYFVGMDKRDKHEYLLGFNTVGEVVFDSKKVALNKVHEAEKHKLNISEIKELAKNGYEISSANACMKDEKFQRIIGICDAVIMVLKEN